jgi:hypothetical protein
MVEVPYKTQSMGGCEASDFDHLQRNPSMVGSTNADSKQIRVA